jgi:hypothetical protein
MFFFSSLKQFSINNTVLVLLRVCNYATKITTETGSAIPVLRRPGGYAQNIGAAGKAYETTVADFLNTKLAPRFIAKIKGDSYPVDLSITKKEDSKVVANVELKHSDPYNYGSCNLWFFGVGQGYGITPNSKAPEAQLAP